MQYQAKVLSGDIMADPFQRDCVVAMEPLFAALDEQKQRHKRWFLLRRKKLQGFYLYGPIGAGKTFLLDLFYDAVKMVQKKRFHFHHFMQEIDAELRRLQGHKDPLQQIARELAASTRLLCFDEFMVEDVANAMILGELLPALLKQGVILIATSNKLPDELYRNGLHRRRFLPAIFALQTHCHLMVLGGQKDYRLGRSLRPNTYLCPLDAKTDRELGRQFVELARSAPKGSMLTIQGRSVECVQYAEGVVWFDFNMICNVPRSQLDYLEIAQRFDTVLVANVPSLDEKNLLGAILLINFIDVMYDAGIRIILSAAVPIEQLYLQGELSQDFQRTASRLQEMQSADYLSRHPHRL